MVTVLLALAVAQPPAQSVSRLVIEPAQAKLSIGRGVV